METLLVVAQHKNQYYNRRRSQGPDINCRTCQSGAGLLPSPIRACAKTVSKRACSSSPLTPHSQEFKPLKQIVNRTSGTSPIPINFNADLNREGFFNDGFSYSELWAGPAYSNSPPPSSLPIPKFSLCVKQTVSLDLPDSAASDMDLHPVAKSAPSSPKRDCRNSLNLDLFHSADSTATKTLRRILNLDIADE